MIQLWIPVWWNTKRQTSFVEDEPELFHKMVFKKKKIFFYF